MTILIGVSNWGASQGWSGEITLQITNAGTDGIRRMKLKINENGGVFSAVHLFVGYSPYIDDRTSCLNTFNSYGYLKFNAAPWYDLAADTARSFKMYVFVEATAPIQVHNLTLEWQYEIY